jgi:hypothetical protein
MTEFERDVRAAIYAGFRDRGVALDAGQLAAATGAGREAVAAALGALAAAHAIVLRDGGESIWMAHPFSGVPTDSVATAGGRTWFANCVWDGLSILALAGGTGRCETRSPASGERIVFEVVEGRVAGEGLVHFLVPASRFWEDIGFT